MMTTSTKPIQSDPAAITAYILSLAKEHKKVIDMYESALAENKRLKEERNAPKKCLSGFCNNMIYPQNYCKDCQRAWES